MLHENLRKEKFRSKLHGISNDQERGHNVYCHVMFVFRLLSALILFNANNDDVIGGLRS